MIGSCVNSMSLMAGQIIIDPLKTQPTMTWSVISGWTSSSSVRLQKRKEARETVINSMMSKKIILRMNNKKVKLLHFFQASYLNFCQQLLIRNTTTTTHFTMQKCIHSDERCLVHVLIMLQFYDFCVELAASSSHPI